MPPSTPVVDQLYTIGEGGQRHFLHPASTRGVKTTLRRRLGWLLMGLLAALPLIDVGGAPAIFLDVEHRRFHVFGLHLGPTDSYLLFFLVTALGFTLVVVSALWGRVWCGYACPQTVFLEQLYRPVERWFEGSREQQLALNRAPWGRNKLLRRGGKWLTFTVLSIGLAHLFVAYFVSAPRLATWIAAGPRAEPGVFAWVACLSALMLGNFAWFREQLCIIICPYGRLQSALSDRDTVVVGYDERRGEPRGKLKSGVSGDCIDCGRCVAVCPTGIDIRQGMQLECVGCASCIDACDEVMLKVARPIGLIRYDSERGLAGEKKRFWRPRVGLYAALLLAGLLALTFVVRTHRPFSTTLTRQPGPPFVIDGDEVRNTFILKVENSTQQRRVLQLQVQVPSTARKLVVPAEVVLEPESVTRVPLVLGSPRGTGAFAFSVTARDDEERVAEVFATFAAP